MADLGQAYVQIVPSADGISSKITQVIDPAAGEAGEKGGKTLAQKLGQSFQGAGKTLTTYMTVPLAAIGAAAGKAWKDMDEGLDTIVIKTGASGEALEGMKGAMEGIATSIPTDFATAGEAVGEVNTRFGLTGEALEELSSQFVKFAQVNGTDVTSSVDGVQKALSSFGLDAENAGDLLDRLTSVGQASGASVETLTQGLITNSGAFQQMGLSIDQAAVFMGDLEKSGANSDAVMQGLRKALKNAAEEGTPLNEALANLQDTILNGTGATDGLTAAYDLFGRSGDQIYQAIQNGTIDFTNLTAAVDECGGTLSTTFEGTLSGPERLQTIFNELKIVGADLASNFLELLAPAIEAVSGFVSNLVEKWRSLSPETQDAIVKAGLIVAAIGPVVAAIGTVITTVTTVISTVKTVGSAISLLASGPVGLIVAAVAAAIAAGIALYENWDVVCEWANTLKEKVIEAWENLKQKVVDAVENLKAMVTEKWESLKTTVTNTVETIKSTITAKWEALKTSVTNAVENIRSKAVEKWENLKSTVTEKTESLRSTVTEKMETLKSNLSAKWEALQSTAATVWEGIKNAIQNPIETAKNIVTSVTSWIEEKLGFSGLTDTVNSIFTTIENFIQNPLETAQSVVTTITDTIENLLGFSGLTDTVNSVFEAVKGFITNPIETAKNTISGIVETIKGFFSGMSLSIPPIKLPALPHFSITGSFSLNPPSVPHLSVSWYAKAMQGGMILDGATIFGMMDGSLLGGGEAGREVIIGEDSLIRTFQRSVSDRDALLAAQNQQIIELLREQNERPTKIYLNSRELTRGLKGMKVAFNG